MKQTHTRRDKGRALFLAALMVLSVFAMSVSFAGAAAAQAEGVNLDPATVNLNDDPAETDITVTADAEYSNYAYAIVDDEGTIVASDDVTLDAVANSHTFTSVDVSGMDEGEYTVYAEAGADVTAPAEGDVGDFGDDGATATLSLIAQVTVDNLGAQDDFYQGQEIEITGFDGSETVELHDGTSSDNSPVDYIRADDGSVTIDTSDLSGPYVLSASSLDGDSDTFWVVEQNINVEFTADTVAQTNTELTYESENRDEAVDLEISSEQLDGEELEAIFGVDNADDGVVTVEDVENGESINADFSDVDTGEYDFTVSVADTTAEADASIEVTEAGEPTAQFDQSSYSEEAGDIVEFTIDMEHVDSNSVQVDLSEKNDNYDATLDVTDEDGDGEVTVYFNTYLAGDDDENAFYTAEDSDDTVVADVDDNTGDSRLLPGGFTLELFTVEGDEPQKVDAAFLQLNDGSIDSVSSGAAPSDADLETVDDIMENSKKSDEIAQGDRVLFAFEASGVFGAIDVGNFDQHFDLVLEQTSNQYDDGTLLMEDEHYTLVEDPEENRFFVVLNEDVELEEDEEYELRLETPDEADEDEENDNDAGSLYFINDEEYKKGSGVIVSSQFSIVERTLEITGDFDKNDRLMVPNHEEATITGHSNAAPGTDIQVNVDGDSMYQGQTVQVQKGGTIEATFDLSEFDAGQEFTVRMMDQDADDVEDEVDAILVKGDKSDDEKDGDEKDDDKQNDNNDDKQNDNNNDDDEQPGSGADEQPGFGIAVALIALLAAAGIALRRQ